LRFADVEAFVDFQGLSSEPATPASVDNAGVGTNPGTVPAKGIGYPSLSKAEVYTNTGAFPNGRSWVNWIIPHRGNIVSLDASFGISVPE